MEEVRNWLQGLGLEQYGSRFEDEGWDTLDILQHMRPRDIETCISKAGHRKKFESGLQTHLPTGGASTSLLINAEISNLDKEAKNELHKSNSSDELQSRGILKEGTSEESRKKPFFNRVDDDNKRAPTVKEDGQMTLSIEKETRSESLGEQTGESQDTNFDDCQPMPCQKNSFKEMSCIHDPNSTAVSTGQPSLVVSHHSAFNHGHPTESSTGAIQTSSSLHGNQEASLIAASQGHKKVAEMRISRSTDENHGQPSTDENEKITNIGDSPGVVSIVVNRHNISAAENKKSIYISDSQESTNTPDSHDILRVSSSYAVIKYDDTSIDIRPQFDSSVNIKDTGGNDFTEICDSETQNSGGLIDIVCVKGARNNILKANLPQYDDNNDDDGNDDAVSKEDKNINKSVRSRRILPLKSNVEKSQQGKDLLLNGSTDSDDNSAVDEHMEGDARAHQWIMCNSGGTFVEGHHHVLKAEEKKQRDNFKDQILIVVQSYRQKDHLYVETKACQEMAKILEYSQWASVIGKSGDGKTAMAAHLLLKYIEKGFEPLIVTNVQDWKEMVKGNHVDTKKDKQFVMIDDMFGSMTVDDRKVNEWLPLIDIMHRAVKEGKGSLVVISTSRTYVFKDVKSKMEKFPCF